MTGAGFYAVRSDEIADYLKSDPEQVNESLERLRLKGRSSKETGTLDDARPIWIYLPR
jgi:predicted transcriptional regulator